MNRTILFSPVGGTDPIPQTNWHDGSMLHIARVYKPDTVYLYMSAEILRLHEADNRYVYCLTKLGEMQNRTMDCRIIKRENLNEVQLFDEFYDDFRRILTDIAKDTNATDTIILNISSGTPAMKSALVVLTILAEYPCKLVQVTTPTKSMNEHDHKGYDVKLLWEGNEDNDENFINRCREIHCPSLSELFREELIKKHLDSYDYHAAREIAAALPEERTREYLPLLDLACARMRLDFAAANILDKETGYGIIPVKADDKQKYFEYALNIDIKRKRKEYTDFIRSITPLVVDLFSLILKHECKIDINDFTDERPFKWNKEKLQQNFPNINKALNNAYNGIFNYGPVYSAHLLQLVKAFSANPKLIALCENLRYVEEKVRNQAAHEIVSLSDAKIKNLTRGKNTTNGYSTEEIMRLIKEAFKFTGLGISPKHWDSFEDMNKIITRKINGM